MNSTRRSPLRPFLNPFLESAAGGRRSGTILILAMGILALLAILGATFVSLMRLEKKATENYIDAQLVDQVNQSAVERVITDLRGATNFFAYTGYRAPWLHKIKAGGEEGDLAHGRFDIESPAVGDWDILSREEKRVYRYKTKVVDCSSQININGRQDSLARMLENLGNAIIRSPNLQKGNQYPLYTAHPQLGIKLEGVQIIDFRNKLEGHKFRTKTQLRDLIGRENYETIKDFITVHSWEDPYTYAPSDGIDEVQLFDIARRGGGRAIGGGDQQGTQPPVERPSSPLSPEPRSPINVNTAPEEVLVACLMGVGGRRAFPYARLAYTVIDEGAQIRNPAGRVQGQEERDNLLPRGVWVYMQPLEYDHAVKIAREIVSRRKQMGREFIAWSTGESARPGFAEFVNGLDESNFPAPNSARIIDPDNPESNEVERMVKGGGNEIGFMWTRGHDGNERSFRREIGMPEHRNNAFYYELAKAALIANFNPNTRINRYNPNAPAYTPVDKSDLVTLDRTDRRTPRKGYTTEFCFDTMGIYQITVLGELAQAPDLVSGKGSGATTVVYGGAPAELDRFEPIYQKKTMSIVQVFDVIRHTSQFHFEKTFKSGNLTSQRDRRYVVTWPDPMEALTDAYSHGSIRDGRVELAGFRDGLRMLSPLAQRQQMYRSPESIVMAHGFQDRDEGSAQQIRRLVRTGNLVSQEVSDRLKDVYKPNYSRVSPIFRNPYFRKEMVSFGLGAGMQSALNNDPAIDREVMGSDLRPDGFHTSLFNSGHLGGRFLLLPAHNRIGQGSGKSGTGTMVGAGLRQDLTGNVPYYRGGIAFWVKFEFDGNDPVFSGLIGCTQVIEDVGMTPPKDTEGTQFYIFKNTKGQLRVVRMYYHQAFPASEGGEGESSGGGLTLWPPVDTTGGGTGSSSGEQRILDLDRRKPISRSDILIDVSHFKAHEWHHIAVDWDDASPAQALSLWIDFEPQRGVRPFIPQEHISGEPNSWVRLNCRRPRDELFIGGFIRHQGIADAGVFKWFTNSIGGTGRANRGVQMVEPSVKRILANATIDELVTYDDTFSSVRSYFATRGSPGYFTNQDGIYSNMMEVPLPPEVDHAVLRSFDWTSYYPAFYTSGQRQPVRLRSRPIQCQLYTGRTNPEPTGEAWRTPGVIPGLAGKPIFRTQSLGVLGRNAELVYRFSLPPGILPSGTLAGGAVQTPVIDDVTMTYFLPDPKILHQEEVD